ncbi:Adaptor protein complex AP-3 delta subunit [Aspergillus steynii IBT 23096]|uniref:AP-3 complex subunit delta n=1 Tax=Aspergillus steynii IBT 23096 TaxID=1392250 RepID=A0A2I2GN44_9EURO|nr:Adaptor protein complex AP-3 delta subunit [Aspergillus steynii IBT 23096]PLB54308.1 Adaptor protein complex AP-3 delta subunit [Aspergillus steynii IBT 23096]
MFEKSLYDLIKGLRTHKGAEEDYVQDCLRECKAEIRLQDMDKKATALLKLIYLEMFGYDMSWASFHVLEVMSSTKYLQKRAGYLAAVQSFRPDTEVLMLATNLLKKDLASSNISNMALPLIALPNIITPSLAMSLLPDVLSRLSHSHAVVRKKAIVCLYRLALVYPEALKLAWPKLKDRLTDDEEETSVTTAVINVVCELGWRRPHDFLPLAPRFFDLLVDGGNNWMAIKIIKLFATLTPLEPRLIRKLIRPLISIIQTTTAMSLLYECINGIIQGGILEDDNGLEGREEIASLCVGKLRGMVVTDSDPNLKYVALLAYNRIVVSYPDLVSTHQDVIMDCLDDPDISIRLQALELAARMVRGNSLQSVITRLIDQLLDARRMTEDGHSEIGAKEGLGLNSQSSQKAPFILPLDYRLEVLHRVLDICSHNNYAELSDFEWYVEILVQLVGLIPPLNNGYLSGREAYQGAENDAGRSVAFRIGSEMRNVAVRVRDVRADATRAAESLLLAGNRQTICSGLSDGVDGILAPFVWIVGEFAQYLSSPGQTLLSLIDMSTTLLPPKSLCLVVQAVPKVLVSKIRANCDSWDGRQQSEISLLLARILVFLETLAAHPDLAVQERAIEFLEVIRLAADALQSDCYRPDEVPSLLSSMIPGLFHGLELNPVAANAQKKVPLPEHLAMDRPFNNNLGVIFDCRTNQSSELVTHLAFQDFYYMDDSAVPNRQPDELNLLTAQSGASYQDPISLVGEPVNVARRKVERREGNFDDPFYIGTEDENSGTSTPFHQTFAASDLDIDAIPIIDLKLSEGGIPATDFVRRKYRKTPEPETKRYNIVSDETIGQDDPLPAEVSDGASKSKKTLLQVDSSGLGRLPFEKEDVRSDSPRPSGSSGHDAEMSMAMQRVERLRLEMQRASERVHTDEFPVEGTLIKKKKVKKPISSKLTEADSLVEGLDAESMHSPKVKKKVKSRSKTRQASP